MMASRLVGISWFKLRFMGLALVGICVVTSQTQAALNAYLEITANGAAVDGESTRTEVGGVDVSAHIECYAVHQEVYKDTGHTGRESHTPIKIIKRVDKATPLLYAAFDQNQTIEGVLKYFKSDFDSGATIQATELKITGGSITGIRHWQPNTLDPDSANLPLMEEISITYTGLEIVDIPSGASHTLSAPTE